MEYEKIRSYEVSIWTLQDDFITVLKPSDLENKGQIEEGIARMNVDGTRELNFRIPMYIEPGVENPAWYNVRKGFIIANMRKIKVIFNKNTEDEYVLEFLITNVDETHENDQLYCEVKCEGLAFHELGKRGYKLALNSDDYYMDEEVAAWYDGDATYQAEHEEPIANIQYWLNKFIKPLPENKDDINSNTWYYEICMDWSSLAATGLESNRIYDEEYATTWTTEDNKLVAASVMPPKEKSRLIDIEESNYYNITQQLAEIFGVFCKYIYEHDANYHITCRKVVFYNSFYSDKLGFLDFTYPHSAEQIRREIDSTDLVTKLYVKSIDDAQSASGLITILDTDANPSGEDYILNFDYLHDVNTINEEQYNQVKIFEATMHALNNQIIPINQRLTVLEAQVPKIQGELTVAKNGAQQDRERIEDANALFNSLTDETGVIHITATNPVSAVLLQDSSNTNKNYYYIKISEKGVIANTVKIYRTINYIDGVLSNELSGGLPQYDEYGNLNRINNLYATENDKKNVYLTYDYSPQLYYDNVKKVWERRLAKDEAEATALQGQLDVINNQITELKARRDSLLVEKNKQLKLFEEEMGPAIREGYWQPENYTDYGNRLIDGLKIDISPLNGEIDCKTPYAKFIWDIEPFVGEQENGYKLGADQQQQYYPCIRLTDGVIELVKNHLEDLSFLFWDFEGTQTYPRSTNKLRSLPLGSQCQLAFIQSDTNNYPVILLTGEKIMADGTLTWMKQNGFIGKLTSTTAGAVIQTNVDIYVPHNSISWLNINDNTPVSYPRIKINSLALKTSSDNISLTYNGEKLSEFSDYSILNREDAYYITLKSSALIRHGIVDKSLSFFYTLSTAATAIYLDALQVSRENAYPKVSYEIDPNVYGKDFMRTAYNTLANLAHINDDELKFDGVMGYISEVELNLDKPWEDKIEIKNYKNKFEDIFSTIVAQTEAMKSAQPILASAAQVLTLDGTIAKNAAKDMIRHVDLNYAFNNGTLTIDNENGIWGTNDSGVVAFRGGGIFTATEKNEEGAWKWNTGITPEGINADLITTGQLDTNLIKIYAGDKVKFQINGDGIYAYRSFFDDMEGAGTGAKAQIQRWINNNIEDGIADDLDKKQYIKYDENGLFLIAEQDALILNGDKTSFIGPLDQTVRRVEVSWDGLKLRNWDNETVFYADPDTGNLTLKGRIEATSGRIGGWEIGTNTLQGSNILLRSSGANSGIYVTSNDTNSYTMVYDGTLYYTYIDPATGTYYYYPESVNSLTVNATNRNNILKQGTDIVSVTPKYIISEEITEKKQEEVEIVVDGQTQKTTIETEYTYTVNYVGSNSTTPIKIDGEKLIYDGSTSPVNAVWYNSLTNAQKNTLVKYQTVPSSTSYDPITTSDLSNGKVLNLISFAPTLSIEAKTGKLTTNYGQLGKFTLTPNSLGNGNLTNTAITGSTIKSSSIEGKPTKNFLRAFCDISGNSATGNYTLTRIDGSTANFNITAMYKYQTDMAVNYKAGYSSGYSSGYSTGTANKQVTGLSKITLSSSDTGTSTKNTTITYNDKTKESKQITIDASAVYKAGKLKEAESVRVSVIEFQEGESPTYNSSTKKYTIPLHAVANSDNTVDGSKYLNTTLSIDASDAYKQGKDDVIPSLGLTHGQSDGATNALEGWTYYGEAAGKKSSKKVYVQKVTVTASATDTQNGFYRVITPKATGSNGATNTGSSIMVWEATLTTGSGDKNQTYYPPSGYNGFSSFTVSVASQGVTGLTHYGTAKLYSSAVTAQADKPIGGEAKDWYYK